MTTPLDAVAAATAAVPRLYPIGSVPATPTYPYGAYSAALGRGSNYALDSETRARRGRVVVQTFGRTAASALAHMEAVMGALLDRSLVITGWRCEPMRADLDQPAVVRDPDDAGVIGVTASWSFTATKEI